MRNETRVWLERTVKITHINSKFNKKERKIRKEKKKKKQVL